MQVYSVHPVEDVISLSVETGGGGLPVHINFFMALAEAHILHAILQLLFKRVGAAPFSTWKYGSELVLSEVGSGEGSSNFGSSDTATLPANQRVPRI